MADIELVIKISEDEYTNIKNAINSLITNGVERASMSKVCLAILGGTPLPKGHGRILDEKDILDTENNDGGWYDLFDMPKYIAGVKAIIEADNGRK